MAGPGRRRCSYCEYLDDALREMLRAPMGQTVRAWKISRKLEQLSCARVLVYKELISITGWYARITRAYYGRTDSSGGLQANAKWYHIKAAAFLTQSRLISSATGSLPEPEPEPRCLSSISGFFPMIIPARSSPIAAP